MSSSSAFLNRDDSNSNAFAIEQLRQEVHELKTLQYEQLRLFNELISILGPVFPSNVEQEAFVEASGAAQQNATASMVNANLRGWRFIQKVPPLAMIIDSRDSGTPSNMARIKAMLKTLKGYEEKIRPEDVTDQQKQQSWQRKR